MSLEGAQYLNLATFRRNGDEVRTPVWFAADGDAYYLFSAGDAGKVKRIRANGQARVARCDARGAVTGSWCDARARLVGESDEIARAYRALRSKYGWQMHLTDLASRLSGRYQKRQIVALDLGEERSG